MGAGLDALLGPLNRLHYRISEYLNEVPGIQPPHRWAATAAILALLPGGGAFYNYQPRRAVLYATVQILLKAGFAYTFFLPINDYFAAALGSWLFYVCADGFYSAAKLNGTMWGGRHLIALWFAMMFFLGASLMAVNYLGYSIIYTTRVASHVQDPAFKKGDRVFVLANPFCGTPEPGAVVYYDPGRYTLTSVGGLSSNVTVVNEKSAFGVVSATEGQVVSMKPDGVLRIDQQPAPAQLLPPTPNGVATIEARVPKGHFAVLMSHFGYEGGVFALTGAADYGRDLPTPRQAANRGYVLGDYEESSIVPGSAILGIALLRYYPPERRTWWGFDGPLHRQPPPDYPKAY
jgi:hypothetical protein